MWAGIQKSLQVGTGGNLDAQTVAFNSVRVFPLAVASKPLLLGLSSGKSQPFPWHAEHKVVLNGTATTAA